MNHHVQFKIHVLQIKSYVGIYLVLKIMIYVPQELLAQQGKFFAQMEVAN
jgi:hypothetical protein